MAVYDVMYGFVRGRLVLKRRGARCEGGFTPNFIILTL